MGEMRCHCDAGGKCSRMRPNCRDQLAIYMWWAPAKDLDKVMGLVMRSANDPSVWFGSGWL